MRHIAAYLLVQISGNASPSVDDCKKVLSSVGVEADEDRLEKLIAELKGKSIDELVAEGSAKFASVPSGGASVSSAPAAGGAAPAADAPAEEEKKKEEEKEESDDDMGFGLFD